MYNIKAKDTRMHRFNKLQAILCVCACRQPSRTNLITWTWIIFCRAWKRSRTSQRWNFCSWLIERLIDCDKSECVYAVAMHSLRPIRFESVKRFPAYVGRIRSDVHAVLSHYIKCVKWVIIIKWLHEVQPNAENALAGENICTWCMAITYKSLTTNTIRREQWEYNW